MVAEGVEVFGLLLIVWITWAAVRCRRGLEVCRRFLLDLITVPHVTSVRDQKASSNWEQEKTSRNLFRSLTKQNLIKLTIPFLFGCFLINNSVINKLYSSSVYMGNSKYSSHLAWLQICSWVLKCVYKQLF